MEAEYELLMTGAGRVALGLRFAAGPATYIPLQGETANLWELVEKCNRGRLDPVQAYEVLEDFGLVPERWPDLSRWEEKEPL